MTYRIPLIYYKISHVLHVKMFEMSISIFYINKMAFTMSKRTFVLMPSHQELGHPGPLKKCLTPKVPGLVNCNARIYASKFPSSNQEVVSMRRSIAEA